MAVPPIVHFLPSTQTPPGETGRGPSLTDGVHGPTPAGDTLTSTPSPLAPLGLPNDSNGGGGSGMGVTLPLYPSGIHTLSSLQRIYPIPTLLPGPCPGQRTNLAHPEDSSVWGWGGFDRVPFLTAVLVNPQSDPTY